MCDIYHTRDGPEVCWSTYWSDPGVEFPGPYRGAVLRACFELAIRDCSAAGARFIVSNCPRKRSRTRYVSSNPMRSGGKPATGNTQSHLPCVKAYRAKSPPAGVPLGIDFDTPVSSTRGSSSLIETRWDLGTAGVLQLSDPAGTHAESRYLRFVKWAALTHWRYDIMLRPIQSLSVDSYLVVMSVSPCVKDSRGRTAYIQQGTDDLARLRFFLIQLLIMKSRSLCGIIPGTQRTLPRSLY